MWELNSPDRVKLIIGILAADQRCIDAAVEVIKDKFGDIDLESDTWDFTKTAYYEKELGKSPLKKIVAIKKTISPGRLAKIKLKANRIEKQLAQELDVDLPRPVNLDPGIIEPSKLVLASTKNFSHRIYLGKKIWAEVTLIFDKGNWKWFDYTFPDHKQQCYLDFFSKVREKLRGQLKSKH